MSAVPYMSGFIFRFAVFLHGDEKYKYIDDLSIIELINLILNGIASYNPKQQVPSDIGIGHKFLHSDHFKTQTYLNNITEWTEQKQMKLNTDKSIYMIFNFSKNYQFNTRLYLEDSLLQQVRQTRLLGVIVSDNLSWHANTANLVKRCYQRMIILKKYRKAEYVPAAGWQSGKCRRRVWT